MTLRFLDRESLPAAVMAGSDDVLAVTPLHRALSTFEKLQRLGLNPSFVSADMERTRVGFLVIATYACPCGRRERLTLHVGPPNLEDDYLRHYVVARMNREAEQHEQEFAQERLRA